MSFYQASRLAGSVGGSKQVERELSKRERMELRRNNRKRNRKAPAAPITPDSSRERTEQGG